jgi:hypothetical protein
MGTRPRIQQQRLQPKAVDPDTVPETVCDGPFNVHVGGNRVTITLTHLRAKPADLLERGQMETEAVVRARIVFSLANLVALRDLLNRLIPDKRAKADAVGGAGGEASVH